VGSRQGMDVGWDARQDGMGWNNGSHNDRCIEVKRKEEVLYSRDAI
tara:strand:- start:178 stop:315 length:138 start_codon:yes stop_codon:yes gene_type:complete